MASINRYAQISETLIDHPKTTRTIRILRMNRLQFVGHIACLWNWAMKNAPDGDLTRFSARDIADAARFTDPDNFDDEADRAAERFINALIECRTSEDGAGFLELTDSEMLIHDWHEFGGKLHKKRVVNTERMREERARAEAETTETAPSDDCAAHVQRTNIARADSVDRTPYRAEQSRAERNVTEQNDNPLPPTPGTFAETLASRPDLASAVEDRFAKAETRYRSKGQTVNSPEKLRLAILRELIVKTPPPTPGQKPRPAVRLRTSEIDAWLEDQDHADAAARETVRGEAHECLLLPTPKVKTEPIPPTPLPGERGRASHSSGDESEVAA